MSDLYADLGVDKNADTETIKKSYRKKAMKAHPDRGGDPEKFHAITRAYDVLTNPARRAQYDKTGEDGVENRVNILSQRLAALFCAQLENFDVDHFDIIEAMKAGLRQGQEKHRQSTAGLKQKISKYERIKKRLKKKGDGENFLAQMVDGQISFFKRAIEFDTEEISRQEEMLKMLADYHYTVDYSDPTVQVNMMKNYFDIAKSEVFPRARR